MRDTSIWEKNPESGCPKHYKQTAQDTNNNDNVAVTVIKSHRLGKFLRIAHMDVEIRHS